MSHEVENPVEEVGGVITSTARTLLVLPALYKWFAIEPAAEEPIAPKLQEVFVPVEHEGPIG